ncbi:ABC transporter substrate-binding protein [Candidatus Halobonum tyrrellensis]|uniref:Iron ABC transporter substrate-binding protein n=1 Tax=Candidatus Halobonum tyrrellensis G22 TaxID=1324957 RepID=V4J3K9_9EURY|nr:ABC transporter substrate-binding protein [Candidatus Halobonum tyrrellensis]ESP89972.1 iron ABC transporter substrate-binding protein [Candidatus Halobonum tyrrellensis G22]
MNDDTTRREYVKYGGAVVGAGILAGCSGDGGESTTGSDATESADPTDPATESATAPATDTPDGGDDGTGEESYAVTMSPVGTVEFDAVPTNFLTYYPLSAGTAVALGHGDSINAIGYDKQLFGDTVDYYYDSLDGVSFDWEGLGRVTPSGDPGSLDAELFYELDSDVHFLDPCLLRSSSFGWSESEIDALAEDIGPWFGNYYSRTDARPPEPCRDDYEYYSLWEYIGKIAAVLREGERYRAFRSLHGEVIGRIESALPPESERPTVAVVAYSGGTFWPYDFTGDGYLWAHVRPFGVTNAFTTTDVAPGADGSYDYEALVEAEPDIVLRYWGTALGDSFLDNRAEVLGDALASEVPAFRNGRYYASGNGMQGPVTNLYQLEMTAKQLFPERFGEWPGYGDGESYPAIPEGERLFDRERVVSIVNGDL